jgi:hypothetical protein
MGTREFISEMMGEHMAESISIKEITRADLENWFGYHNPTLEQKDKYCLLREGGLTLAKLVLDVCPPGPDRTIAIRKIREAVMTANAAIACPLEIMRQ